MHIQSSAETYIRFIMNSIGGKTLSPDIIGTATISGAKLFLMKDLKLIYIFQDKLIIKFYFKVTKRNANLPFLSVNFPSVCSEITSQIVCKFLQIIVSNLVMFSKPLLQRTTRVRLFACLLALKAYKLMELWLQ